MSFTRLRDKKFEMKRRTFIGLSAISAASLTTLIQNGCNPKAVDKSLGQPLSLSHILDTNQIREIGLAYRKQFPAENNIRVLADLLTNEDSLEDFTDSLAVRTILDKRTTTDFDEGRIVIVNGWVLAENEARQCALFSILQS
jgi:hypothetical protein